MTINDLVQKKISICAVIAVRNGAKYLKVLLPFLAQQDIDVAIIDNESTDNSYELYSQFKNKPIIIVETLPYKGFFSLSQQLISKQMLYKKLHHDWIIHHDVDEIMEHNKPGLTLRDAIEQADKAGYNAINFDEFVFLPEPNSDYSQSNYHTELLRYYFFEPVKNRLNRSFDKVDLSNGWHGNRLNFNESNLLLPKNSDFLFYLSIYNSKNFCRTNPASQHFWEWNDSVGESNLY